MDATAAAWATFVVTTIYAIITLFMLLENRNMVKVMKRQLEDTNRPYLTVHVGIEQQSVICLYLKNTSNFYASNVKFSLDKDFYSHRDITKNIRDFKIFQDLVPSFAPNEKYMIHLCQSWDIDIEEEQIIKCPSNFEISVDYEFGTKRYEDKHAIDLKFYMNTNIQISLIDALGKISKSLEIIANKK